jgi:FkbM family methyltransferase
MNITERLRTKIRGLEEVLQFDNRIQLLISRLLTRPAVDVYHYRGLEILVDYTGGDVNSIRACLATPKYRKFVSRMALRKIGCTIVDIGANAGGFSLMLWADGYRPARLVAVELNPQTYHRLALNLERNIEGTQTTILNEGVFSRTGSVEVKLGRGSTSDSISRPAMTAEGSSKRRLPTTTLDDLFERTVGVDVVDLCKMDIEGSEWDVFLNHGHERIRQCANVLMEIHSRPGALPGELVDRMALLGLHLRDRDEDVYWFESAAKLG